MEIIPKLSMEILKGVQNVNNQCLDANIVMPNLFRHLFLFAVSWHSMGNFGVNPNPDLEERLFRAKQRELREILTICRNKFLCLTQDKSYTSVVLEMSQIIDVFKILFLLELE